MGFFDGINFAVSDGVSAVASGAEAGGWGGAALGSAIGAAADAPMGGVGTTASTPASGGIMMDRDEMESFRQQVIQTRELCAEQLRGNQAAVAADAREDEIKPPALDEASTMFTKTAQNSRVARNQYLQQQLAMYNELVVKLEKALGLTTESDERATDAVNQAAGGGKYS